MHVRIGPGSFVSWLLHSIDTRLPLFFQQLIQCSPGDSVGVIVPNEAPLVLGLCARLGLQPDTLLSFNPAAGSNGPTASSEGAPILAAVASGFVDGTPVGSPRKQLGQREGQSPGSPARRDLPPFASNASSVANGHPARLSLPGPAPSEPSFAAAAIPRSTSAGGLANAAAATATPGAQTPSGACNLIPEWFSAAFSAPYRAVDVLTYVLSAFHVTSLVAY
jgi:hypothetical protein